MRLTSYLKGGLGSHKTHDIVTYKLSPYELKAFAGTFSHGFPNMLRRFRSNVYIVTPPFILGYLIYSWAEAEHHHLSRKDPAEFANDE